MPRPRWANAVPQAERGRPAARRATLISGARSNPVRSTMSVTAPAMTNSAKPDAERRQQRTPLHHEGRGDPDQRHHEGAAQALGDAGEIAALPGQQRSERQRDQQRQRTAARRSLKNGAPTEIFSPVSASSASG